MPGLSANDPPPERSRDPRRIALVVAIVLVVVIIVVLHLTGVVGPQTN